MLKKFLVTLCVLASLLTVMLLPTQAAEVEPSFYAGYSRVDINPYVVDGDFSSGIMELPLRGTGDVWNRLSKKMVDDNGDGKVTAEDGLKATCIAISDQNGNTVLLITIDLIGGTMVDEVRDEVYSRVQTAIGKGELTNVKLTRDQIHYAGTHTHNAPDTTVYSKNGKTGTNDEGKDLNTINTNLGIWMKRTIEDVGDAAILALKDRAAATITKDAIKASEDNKSPVKGKVMNTVRHYWAEDNGCYAGDNFNDRGKDPKQVTKVNDTMYLLKFSFEDTSKLPIVLANWRGHPSLNNTDLKGVESCSRNCISSDYVNSFRHALEYKCVVNGYCTGRYADAPVYRAAFFQGSGGNVNPYSREVKNKVAFGRWIDDYADYYKDSKGNGYGRVLAAMAQHGLDSYDGREKVPYGELRSIQQNMNVFRRDTGINALSYDAAKAFQAAYEINKNTKLPFIYENEDGEKFVIGSRFHANNIVSYWSATYQKAVDGIADMELCTFMFGEKLAFVTISGEAFDYYYKELGVYTENNNLWNELVGAEYGTPFVLGYCNGADGYVPNYEAYDYNLGSDKWMRGSYESNISPYQQGTGEKMIGILDQMLGMLEGGKTAQYSAYCQHCGAEATWTPYNGTAKLTTGHYYLISDVIAPQVHIGDNKDLKEQKVCFDLKGYTITGESRVFYTVSGANATLSIMDTSEKQTGNVQGCGGSVGAGIGFGGATLIVDKGSVYNIYGGTIRTYARDNHSVYRGGVILVNGTLNLYGGTVEGGTVSNFIGQRIKDGVPADENRTAQGATIYNNGKVNLYGGKIMTGTVNTITGTVYKNKYGTYSYKDVTTPTNITTDCIYMTTSGRVTVAGDAVVGNLYLPGTSSSYLTVDAAEKKFTGKLGITLSAPLPTSSAFGKCTENTDLSEATFTFTNGDLSVYAEGTNLKATAGALTQSLDGKKFHYYDTLPNALKAYAWSETEPSYIKLMAACAEPVQLKQNLYLDLNGCNVDGNITVAEGSTLYCMDNQTNDYKVSDNGVYGKLTGAISGDVEGVPAMTVGYKPSSSYSYRLPSLKITEADGVSFHTLRLHLRYVHLQPTTAGIYYSAYINGDEVIQSHVDSFGIALNANEPILVNGVPSPYNRNVAYTADQWKSPNYYYSVLVDGVMKQENSEEVNASHAQTSVYACPYIVLDGETVYGFEEAWSFQQLVEAADEGKKFKKDALTEALKLYEAYQSVMENWRIPRLKQEYNKLEYK